MTQRYRLGGDQFTLTKHNSFTSTERKGISRGNLEGMFILVNLGDQRNYTNLINGVTSEAKKLHTLLGLVKEPTEGMGYAAAKTHLKFTSLMIKKEYLFDILPDNKSSKFIFDFFDGKTTDRKNGSNKKTNPKTQTLAHEILQTPYTNHLDKLYLEAKSLELLHTELNSLLSNDLNKTNQIKFSNQDKEAIYYAREILMNNTSNPPSLKELSYQVKINEFKLKIGFNIFFNQTPYSISLESRLQEAKKLLEKSELNINEIASKVGYKYAQSFSNAYVKRFGIRPKNLMKSRKYYY